MKKSSSVNQLGHILYDHKEGKFNEEDVVKHIRDFMKIIPNENQSLVVGEMKQSLETIYHTLHQEMVDIMWSDESTVESKENQNDSFMTVKEVCHECDITKPTFYQWKKRGLKTIKQGGRVYILKSELSRFLKTY